MCVIVIITILYERSSYTFFSPSNEFVCAQTVSRSYLHAFEYLIAFILFYFALTHYYYYHYCSEVCYFLYVFSLLPLVSVSFALSLCSFVSSTMLDWLYILQFSQNVLWAFDQVIISICCHSYDRSKRWVPVQVCTRVPMTVYA